MPGRADSAAATVDGWPGSVVALPGWRLRPAPGGLYLVVVRFAVAAGSRPRGTGCWLAISATPAVPQASCDRSVAAAAGLLPTDWDSAVAGGRRELVRSETGPAAVALSLLAGAVVSGLWRRRLVLVGRVVVVVAAAVAVAVVWSGRRLLWPLVVTRAVVVVLVADVVELML